MKPRTSFATKGRHPTSNRSKIQDQTSGPKSKQLSVKLPKNRNTTMTCVIEMGIRQQEIKCINENTENTRIPPTNCNAKTSRTVRAPFEARPKIRKVVRTPVANSGNPEVDALAKHFWDKRSSTLHTISSEPPPLAPVSNKEEIHDSTVPAQQGPSNWETIPPLAQETAEEDYDILALSTLEISDDEPDEDLFRDIHITDTQKDRCCMIYPKGRPKVQVRVKKGIVTLRCNGKIKTYKPGN
ncbi:hypothetical protein EVAR_60625_1 [Eumeta japonica]|uniref:Uncharacterized protein n=1 Tax=Eumeta variegata TaxID=151549 RepID=A0A4C1TAG4_EUMVA|nr:hypothetical protein EVAR_60625_1 [Eumeta japonica]